MLSIFNERLLKVVLFKMNNESLDFCEYKTKNRDLNNYLLIQSLFTKIILNENCEKWYLYSLTRIKIIFILCFIMSDDRSILNLLLRLIFGFNLFHEERNDFKFKENSSLKLELKSFSEKNQHENIKNNLVFVNVYVDAIWFTLANYEKYK